MEHHNEKLTNEMVDIQVFLKDPALVTEINRMINHYHTTHQLDPEPRFARKYRWKRTPEDSFIENFNFNAMYMIDQFLRITSKTSNLPKSQRDCINYYVVSAMQQLYWKNKQKELKEDETRKAELDG